MNTVNEYFYFVLVSLTVFFSRSKLSAQQNQSISEIEISENKKKLSSVSFQMVDKYVKNIQSKSSIDFLCNNATVKLEICTEDILRIRMSPPEVLNLMKPGWLLNTIGRKTYFKVEDKASYISITTSRLLIKAFKTPL